MHRFALCVLALLTSAVLTAPASVRAAEALPPAAGTPLTSFDIVYVDADLREPGLATAGPDSDFVDWKILDVAALMQQRAPKVLAINGLGGTGVLVPAPAPGTTFDIASVASSRPVLLLRIASLTKSRPTPFSKAGVVDFDVRLFDRDAGAVAPIWRARLGGGLGFDPVLGLLKTNRVDAAWVDGILALALDKLAQKGLVQLAASKAALPKD
jgi:hypothetical protein